MVTGAITGLVLSIFHRGAPAWGTCCTASSTDAPASVARKLKLLRKERDWIETDKALSAHLKLCGTGCRIPRCLCGGRHQDGPTVSLLSALLTVRQGIGGKP